MRECDDYCPACLSERVCSRFFHIATPLGKMLACFALAGLTFLSFKIARDRWQEREARSNRPHLPVPPPKPAQIDPFKNWINTPTH